MKQVTVAESSAPGKTLRLKLFKQDKKSKPGASGQGHYMLVKMNKTGANSRPGVEALKHRRS